MRIKFITGCSESIGDEPSHLRHDMFNNIYFHLCIILIEVSLKITITHLVAVFKFSKIFCLFLNCVIRQMYKFVAQIREVELSAACSDVAILIKVSFERLIY
jgi:hypothetical protein